MATRRPGGPRGSGSRGKAAGRRARARTGGGAARTPKPSPGPQPAPPSGPFRLGAIEGATPGKWIRVWEERMPRTPLELIPLAVASAREAIASGAVDAAIVRLPIDRDGLHVIALYDEVPVVVMSVDADLSAADELETADLAGEVLIRSADDVLGFTASGALAPAFEPPATAADAVAAVATGIGVAVMPMSLARLHHRKDVTYRPLRDGPASAVALAWDADRTTPFVDTFVGIVRGRTANSSR